MQQEVNPNLISKRPQFHFRDLAMKYALYLIMFLIIIVIACISPKFLSLRVLRDIMTQSTIKIIVALGCMFIIISGSADLSGGRMVGLAAVFAGSLAQTMAYSRKFFPALPELSFIVPVLAAVAIGLLFGWLNGFAVAKLKVPAFLATLGTQMIIFGINVLYFNLPPNNAQPLGGYRKDFSAIGTGSVFGIPYLVIISVVCMILVYILLKKTCLGKEIYAVGGNPEAARVSGINVFGVQLFTFAIAGALYGLAGSMEAARTGSASPNYGFGYELDAIASCIVGGCSLSGGVGSVPGVFLGVIIFTVINYGLTFLGISTDYQNILKGAIIIAAVAIDVRKDIRKT